MPESLAVLGGRAKPERLCSVIPGHTAGLKNGLPGRRGTYVFHVCLLKGPDVTEPLLFILAVLLPAPLAGCSSWRAQRLLQWDPLLWIHRLCGKTISNTSWHCSKPRLSSLSFRPFILTQENKVVKSRSQLYMINTLTLPCIHTNMKRLEPSYFPSKLDITQLWSRYAYPFLSETYWPKINIPLSHLNVFIETPLLTFHSTFEK